MCLNPSPVSQYALTWDTLLKVCLHFGCCSPTIPCCSPAIPCCSPAIPCSCYPLLLSCYPLLLSCYPLLLSCYPLLLSCYPQLLLSCYPQLLLSCCPLLQLLCALCVSNMTAISCRHSMKAMCLSICASDTCITDIPRVVTVMTHCTVNISLQKQSGAEHVNIVSTI